MFEFQRTKNAFNYVFEKELAANETVVLKMPDVSPNKRSINDIGWQSDGDIAIYGTLSSNPESDTALWQEIKEGNEVNKTIYAIKIVSGNSACNVVVRIIMN